VIISAVTHDFSEAKVTVIGVPDRPGVAARLFGALADANVNVDMIIQNVSEQARTDISFTVSRDDLEKVRKVAGDIGEAVGAAGVDFDDDIAKISRRGDAKPPGHRRRHVPDASGQRHKHRDDLDVSHQDILRRPSAGRRESGPDPARPLRVAGVGRGPMRGVETVLYAQPLQPLNACPGKR
jgi:predicted amino acid-binding ACT domain protein